MKCYLVFLLICQGRGVIVVDGQQKKIAIKVVAGDIDYQSLEDYNSVCNSATKQCNSSLSVTWICSRFCSSPTCPLANSSPKDNIFCTFTKHEQCGKLPPVVAKIK